MPNRIAIKTDKAPQARPIFHQGIKQGPFVQVSGQGPQDPATGAYLYPGDIKAQTVRTLDNVNAILEAAGASMDDVLILRVYITKREDFAPMSEAYGDWVKAHCKGDVLPCRTTVTTGLPNEDMLVEIDALAYLGE